MNKTLLNSTRNVEQKAKNKDASGNLIAEADGNNEITRYYIHGAGLLAMVTPSNQVYSYHFNGTGSTVAMTDAAQSVINQYRYDPFGNIINQSETIPQPFTFVGQYGVMTEPNGFYYMRARYYDPQVGRFISEDPIGFDGGDVNLYAYVGNNPIMGVDPWGRCSTGTQNGLDTINQWLSRTSTVLTGAGIAVGTIQFGAELVAFSGAATGNAPLTAGAGVVAGVAGSVNLFISLSSATVAGTRAYTDHTYTRTELARDLGLSTGNIAAGFIGTKGGQLAARYGSEIILGTLNKVNFLHNVIIGR